MKSDHSLDICNIQFSSLSYVLQISCAHFFQKAVQTGSHIFTRSPAEGIKKNHIFLFLRETIFQLAWLELRNKSSHTIYICNPIYYFSSLARKASNLSLAFIIFSGTEAADNCPILLQCNLSVQQDTLNHLLWAVELANIFWRHNQVSFTPAVQKGGILRQECDDSVGRWRANIRLWKPKGKQPWENSYSNLGTHHEVKRIILSNVLEAVGNCSSNLKFSNHICHESV